jgi:hypothetical protein
MQNTVSVASWNKTRGRASNFIDSALGHEPNSKRRAIMGVRKMVTPHQIIQKQRS